MRAQEATAGECRSNTRRGRSGSTRPSRCRGRVTARAASRKLTPGHGDHQPWCPRSGSPATRARLDQGRLTASRPPRSGCRGGRGFSESTVGRRDPQPGHRSPCVTTVMVGAAARNGAAPSSRRVYPCCPTSHRSRGTARGQLERQPFRRSRRLIYHQRTIRSLVAANRAVRWDRAAPRRRRWDELCPPGERA